MELWISQVCLGEGHGGWTITGEGEVRMEGKLQRPMGLG